MSHWSTLDWFHAATLAAEVVTLSAVFALCVAAGLEWLRLRLRDWLVVR